MPVVGWELLVDGAIEKYLATLQGDLIKGVIGGHVEGQVTAARLMGVSLGHQVATTQALSYAQEYARLLIQNGGTMINGEFVPWFQKYDVALREQFTSIIQDAMVNAKSEEELGSIISELLKSTQSHGEMIAHHEIRQVQVYSAVQQYQDMGVNLVDVVGYDIHDGTICLECEEYLANSPYPIDKAPYLPAHPHCRHGLAPHIEGITEGMTPAEEFTVEGI